jgi:hypothetical protein
MSEWVWSQVQRAKDAGKNTLQCPKSKELNSIPNTGVTIKTK